MQSLKNIFATLAIIIALVIAIQWTNIPFMDAVLVQGASKLMIAIIAILICRISLIYMDRVAGFNFTNWLEQADSRDKALYYGCRILAICLLVGLVLS